MSRFHSYKIFSHFHPTTLTIRYCYKCKSLDRFELNQNYNNNDDNNSRSSYLRLDVINY